MSSPWTFADAGRSFRGRAIRRTLLCLSLVSCIPLPAVAQSARPAQPPVVQARSERTFNREVFADSEARIGAMNWVNSDCSSGELPSLRFVSPPQKGAMRTADVAIPMYRPSHDARASCNGEPVQALAVFYKPDAGYTGPDTVVIDVDFHKGNVARLNYKITVR